MQVGTVEQVWRYPFKSMMGELLEQAEVGSNGLYGDRGWAVRDEVRGGIRGAKKIPALMQCQARYPEPPSADRTGPAEITVPDGTSFLSNAPDAAARLSRALEHDVTIWPILPPDNLEHYRRGKPTHDNWEDELRAIFALEPGEPLPDLTGLPEEIVEYESPPGTYFDAFPLLAVTQASLDTLQGLTPRSRIDARRFRPNFLIDTADANGFVETGWPGRRLRLGSLTIDVEMNCMRCVMTTLGFANLPKDPNIMRTLVREADQNLGVYATVATPGRVSVGDRVELLD